MKLLSLNEAPAVVKSIQNRVLVLAFTSGGYAQIPVTDRTVIQVGAQSFSMEDCNNILLLDPDDSLLASIAESES